MEFSEKAHLTNAMAARMQQEFQANQHKDAHLSGFATEDVLEAMTNIVYHTIKLTLAAENGDAPYVAEFAADVANEAVIAIAVTGSQRALGAPAMLDHKNGDPYGLAIKTRFPDFEDQLREFLKKQILRLDGIDIKR